MTILIYIFLSVAILASLGTMGFVIALMVLERKARKAARDCAQEKEGSGSSTPSDPTEA